MAHQQATRAHDSELQLRRHQQRRAGWMEANADLGPTYRGVVRELAWQRRAHGLALEQEPPGYLRAELGPVSESTRGRRAWRQAAAAIEDYRQSYDVREPDRALGPAPRDPTQRTAWQHAHDLVERVWGKQRTERDRQPTTRDYTGRDHPDARQQPPRQRPVGRQGPERAAG